MLNSNTNVIYCANFINAQNFPKSKNNFLISLKISDHNINKFACGKWQFLSKIGHLNKHCDMDETYYNYNLFMPLTISDQLGSIFFNQNKFAGESTEPITKSTKIIEKIKQHIHK